MEDMYYVYLLKSVKTQKLYIGYTANLRKRFAEHNRGMSKATKPYIPFELAYYEACLSKTDARKREMQLKGFKQAYTRLKERIINSIAGQN